MSNHLEELWTRHDTVEKACLNAQQRIDQGGLIGGLIGRVQRWANREDLRQITDEIDCIELCQRLAEEASPIQADS